MRGPETQELMSVTERIYGIQRVWNEKLKELSCDGSHAVPECIDVSRRQQKAMFHLRPTSCRKKLCLECAKGLVWGPNHTDVCYRGPAFMFTQPSDSHWLLFEAWPWEWHFKVAPVAVTSAWRNVTGCFVPHHWHYPMCYNKHPPEKNKKTPQRGFHSLLGNKIDVLTIQFSYICQLRDILYPYYWNLIMPLLIEKHNVWLKKAFPNPKCFIFLIITKKHKPHLN